MNTYQTTLYNDLMKLANSSDAFYFADQKLDDRWYRIFNYRMCSYSEFLKPNALECRGHMFEITEEGENAEMLRVAALPMSKFFNLNENPFTMELDLSSVDMIEDKADGSLISSYVQVVMDEDNIWLKSKGSLSSPQAEDSMVWLEEYPTFKQELLLMGKNHFTVNMEWCAPFNRIVLPYNTPHLKVLNIRNNLDGTYMDLDDLPLEYPEIRSRWTERFKVDDPATFVGTIPDMKGIEGFIIRLESGQRVKIKTAWYMALHHTKDSINSPRRLFEAVCEEATDDMKSLFHDDMLAIATINKMEEFVAEKFNHMVEQVETYYKNNKDLSRKDYAINGQKELDKMYFGLAMNKYVGNDFSYRDFLKSQWKKLGLKESEEDNG